MMRVLFLSFLLMFASPAMAAEGNSFIYSKTILKIVPKPEEQVLQPAQDAKAAIVKKGDSPAVLAKDMLPVLRRVPKEFTVEVRAPSFLTQTDFIAHQPFTDQQGMLILIDPPAISQVEATRMIATADVLFVNEDGLIIKIAPSLKLTGLTEPVDSGKPIHAFVYLKAGTTEASDIRVGDHIESSFFKTHPIVIQ